MLDQRSRPAPALIVGSTDTEMLYRTAVAREGSGWPGDLTQPSADTHNVPKELQEHCGHFLRSLFGRIVANPLQHDLTPMVRQVIKLVVGWTVNLDCGISPLSLSRLGDVGIAQDIRFKFHLVQPTLDYVADANHSD